MKEDFIEQLKGIKEEKTFILPDLKTYIRVVGRKIELFCYSSQYEDILNIVKYFTKNGYFINSIVFNILEDTKTKSMTEIDYTYAHKIKKYLDSIHNNTNISFTYDTYDNANYEDFFGMIESLKWYRSLVIDNDLSPVERFTFAYDICKTFPYTKSGETKKDIINDNTLHLIIKTGNIVCLGYNKLLYELVFGIDGIKASEFSTKTYHTDPERTANHSRGIVKIDDDKYDIHGIYIFDATSDRINEIYADYYGKQYGALSAYRHFLVPIHQYKRFFSNSTYPRIFIGKHNENKEQFLTKRKLDKIVNSSKQNNRVINKKVISPDIALIIPDDMTVSEFYQYLNCERPDVFDFIDIIINVRYCEGYDNNTLSEELVFGIDDVDKDKAITIEDDVPNKKIVL